MRKSTYMKNGIDVTPSHRLCCRSKINTIEQVKQLVSELKGIEQFHIDANPECFRTKEFINRLTVRLDDIVNSDADRKKAEKIVRDSMPKVVKDVLDGKYRKYRKGV